MTISFFPKELKMPFLLQSVANQSFLFQRNKPIPPFGGKRWAKTTNRTHFFMISL